MPIYEYSCEKCGERFELKMSFNALDGVDCVRCGGEAKRVISRFSFTFADGRKSQVNPNARQVRG